VQVQATAGIETVTHHTETAPSIHTWTFFQSTPCVFSLHHAGK